VFEAHLKKRTEWAFEGMARLVKRWACVNTITTFAFFSGIVSGICIAVHYQWAAFFLLSFSGLCDVLDGRVARLTNTASQFGAFRDLVSDRMVESAIVAGIAWGYPQHAFACLLFVIALLLHFSTFGMAALLFKNLGEKSFHYNKSFVDRIDAFIVFGFVILFPQYSTIPLMALNIFIFADGIRRFKAIVDSET